MIIDRCRTRRPSGLECEVVGRGAEMDRFGPKNGATERP